MAVYIPVGVRQEVRQRAQQRCEYCQSAERLTGFLFTIDHIIPRSAGGADSADNLCLACTGCNGHKHARTTAVDPQTGMTVPVYHPRRQHWQEHFEWSTDGQSVIGVTPVGRATVNALQLNRAQLVNSHRLWVSAGWHPPGG